MLSETATRFRLEMDALRVALGAVSDAFANIPWRDGGWTRKQILGHLLDSATNNRQRFVRAAIDGLYTGPSYAQEAWVEAHGYEQQPWKRLVDWWGVEHDILIAVVDRIAEDRMDAPCNVGQDPAVTLRYLIEDYARHQDWHIKQISAPVSGS